MSRVPHAPFRIIGFCNILSRYNSGAGWGQLRSPLFLYEQFVAPPQPDMAKLGCGELNVVTVMEPLKAARLILGVSDWAAGNVSLVPRVAPQWHADGAVAIVTADNWPIAVALGVTARASIVYASPLPQCIFVTMCLGTSRAVKGRRSHCPSAV